MRSALSSWNLCMFWGCFGWYVSAAVGTVDWTDRPGRWFLYWSIIKGDWNCRGSHLFVCLGKLIQGYWRRIKLIVKPWIQAEQYDCCPGCGTLVQLHSFFDIHLLHWEEPAEVARVSMPLCSDYCPRDLCLHKQKKWEDVKELVNNRVIQNCAKFINYAGYTDDNYWAAFVLISPRPDQGWQTPDHLIS